MQQQIAKNLSISSSVTTSTWDRGSIFLAHSFDAKMMSLINRSDKNMSVNFDGHSWTPCGSSKQGPNAASSPDKLSMGAQVALDGSCGVTLIKSGRLGECSMVQVVFSVNTQCFVRTRQVHHCGNTKWNPSNQHIATNLKQCGMCCAWNDMLFDVLLRSNSEAKIVETVEVRFSYFEGLRDRIIR